MKFPSRYSAVLALGVAVSLASPNSNATGTVRVNGYSFYCENECVVTQTSSGMVVSDSQNGWVTIWSAVGRMPVPA